MQSIKGLTSATFQGLHGGFLVAMPASNRGAVRSIVDATVIVALLFLVGAVIWSVASNATRDQIQAERYSEHYADDANDRIKRECAERQGTAMTECIEQVVETAHEQERSEKDLAAQRGMERWAYWMLIATLGSVAVTTVGVVYVAFTLREARETTAASIRGAVAAELSVGETTRIGEAQMRAYLTCVGGEFTAMRGGTLIISFKIKNTGQTPAYDVQHWLEWGATDQPFDSSRHDRPNHSGQKRSKGTVGIDGETQIVTSTDHPGSGGGPSLSREQWQKVIDGKLGFWVYGQIDYVDAFKVKRFTRYRYKANRRGDILSFDVTDEGNEAS